MDAAETFKYVSQEPSHAATEIKSLRLSNSESERRLFTSDEALPYFSDCKLTKHTYTQYREV